MVTLYSLPTCGICKMIKTKLEQKHIPFMEKDFSEIAETIHSDRAPVLIFNNNEGQWILNSPVTIVDWINSYQE